MKIKKFPLLFGSVVAIAIFCLFYCMYTTTEGFDATAESQTLAANVDVFYYINLDDRPDRKKHFLQEMAKMQIPDGKIVRVQAIKHESNGHIGCTMSHIKALKLFMDSDYRNCIIFEDDFKFSFDKTAVDDKISTFIKHVNDFDVCMLAYSNLESRKTNYPFLLKAVRATTTSGYMIKQSPFLNKLLENFEEGLRILTETNKGENAIDQYWFSLQAQSDTFYMFDPALGEQNRSELSSSIQNLLH